MHPKALAYQQEGLAFKERGEWAAARDAFLAALELDARYDEARYELAQALAALGDLAGAATHSQTLLDNQPNHLGAALLLGTSLRKLGRRGEAIGALQRVLFIDSSVRQGMLVAQRVGE